MTKSSTNSELKISKLKNELISTHAHIKNLEYILEKQIKPAKTFKLWQKYNNFKKLINLNPLILLKFIKILVEEGPFVLVTKIKKKINFPEINIVYNDDTSYKQWIVNNEPKEKELLKQIRNSRKFNYKPLISIITPVYKVPLSVFRETVESVLKQTYTNWELCITDASNNKQIKKLLLSYSKKDKRLKIKFVKKNYGISNNSNIALELAKGEFIGLLDHDDVLAPFALHAVVEKLNENNDIDFIYSDRDLISADGLKRFNPLFKPDWSPEILFSSNYLCHFTVIRKKLIDSIGGFRSKTDGAQDWDLFMRITEKTTKITHIPKILYHWKDIPTSAATSLKAKPYVPKAQIKVVQSSLDRRKINAKAYLTKYGLVGIRWNILPIYKISIIIPTANKLKLLKNCINTILKRTKYKNYEIIIVENKTRGEEIKKFYKEVLKNKKIKTLQYFAEFNFSKLCNLGASRAKGEILLFLNDDIEIIEENWLEEMLGWTIQKDIGAVGAKLLRLNMNIQHAGVIVGLTGFSGHIFSDTSEGYIGIFGSTEWYRNYLAVTAACLMIRKSIFNSINGFDEELEVAGNDVELCLRLYKKGYRILYNPNARLLHLETASRTRPIPFKEFKLSSIHYKPFLKANDPYYNNNLSYWNNIPSLKKPEDKLPKNFVNDFIKSPEKSLAQPTKIKEETTSIWNGYQKEALWISDVFDFNQSNLQMNHRLINKYYGKININTVDWFIPNFDTMFAGISNIFRLANYLATEKEVVNRFIVDTHESLQNLKTLIYDKYPNLKNTLIINIMHDVNKIPSSDVAIATLWTTAYHVMKFNKTKRKIYLIQDFEPYFYPSGSEQAIVENTYKFGFYGVTTAETLKQMYNEYDGKAIVLNTPINIENYPKAYKNNNKPPYVVIFYARPDHPRNGFELGITALKKLKAKLTNKVKIITFGSNWHPSKYNLEGIVENFGIISKTQLIDLYQRADVGLFLMFSHHPGVIAFELMANNCPVVVNNSTVKGWKNYYMDKKNSIVSNPTASEIADNLQKALLDKKLRKILIKNGLITANKFNEYTKEANKVYDFMCNPNSYNK